jgi:hypothetical protein
MVDCQGIQIIYKLYAHIAIDGIFEYRYSILGTEPAQCDMAMRWYAGCQHHALRGKNFVQSLSARSPQVPGGYLVGRIRRLI